MDVWNGHILRCLKFFSNIRVGDIIDDGEFGFVSCVREDTSTPPCVVADFIVDARAALWVLCWGVCGEHFWDFVSADG